MGKQSAERKLESNQAIATLRMLRVSPIKLNSVANLVRGLNAEDALIQLTFCNKRISDDLKKLLLSAIANAENNHNLDVDSLVVSEIRVGKALVMKRFRARARGRGAQILKPYSNVSIVLTEVESK